MNAGGRHALLVGLQHAQGGAPLSAQDASRNHSSNVSKIPKRKLQQLARFKEKLVERRNRQNSRKPLINHPSAGNRYIPVIDLEATEHETGEIASQSGPDQNDVSDVAQLSDRPQDAEAASSSSTGVMTVLKGTRDELFPVPSSCKPPAVLFINAANPLLSQSFHEAPASVSTPLPQRDQTLLNIQDSEVYLASISDDVSSTSLHTPKPSLVGQLTAMCSVDEMVDKQRTSTASDLERLPATLQADHEARLVNRHLAVKSFQRSDANKVFKASEIRPVVWCRKTIHNLLALHLSADQAPLPWLMDQDAVAASDVSTLQQWRDLQRPQRRVSCNFLSVYSFLRDRFRSVWQDLTVQHCPKHRGFIESLEISFRFLILSEELLCENSSFNAVQNGELMNTCLDKLMGGYADSRYAQTTLDPPMFQAQADRDILDVLVFRSPFEAEFWAYRIVTTLPNSIENSNAILDMYRKIPKDVCDDLRVRQAFAAHKAFRDRNICRYFKIMHEADYLLAALLHKYANLMRAMFLEILGGRCSRQCPTLPFNVFRKQFAFCESFKLQLVPPPPPRDSPLFSSWSPRSVNIANAELTVSSVAVFLKATSCCCQPADINPKKLRCKQFQSAVLRRRWEHLGLNRQCLLDPDFPAHLVPLITGKQLAFPTTDVTSLAKIRETPEQALPSSPVTQKQEAPSASPRQEPPSSVFTAPLPLGGHKAHTLSPFAASLLGLQPPPSVGPSVTPSLTPSHSASDSGFPRSATRNFTLQNRASAHVAVSTATSPSPSRLLQFPFEGLTTPERGRMSTMDESPSPEPTSRGREVPKFGVSDSETSEPEATKPPPSAPHASRGLAEARRTEEVSSAGHSRQPAPIEPPPRRMILKRKHSESVARHDASGSVHFDVSVSSSSSSSPSLPSVQTSSATTAQRGATTTSLTREEDEMDVRGQRISGIKRRQRQPSSQAAVPPEPPFLLPHPTRLTVTSCLTPLEQQRSSDHSFSFLDTLRFQFSQTSHRENTVQSSVANVLAESLLDTRWSFLMASADCIGGRYLAQDGVQCLNRSESVDRLDRAVMTRRRRTMSADAGGGSRNGRHNIASSSSSEPLSTLLSHGVPFSRRVQETLCRKMRVCPQNSPSAIVCNGVTTVLGHGCLWLSTAKLDDSAGRFLSKRVSAGALSVSLDVSVDSGGAAPKATSVEALHETFSFDTSATLCLLLPIEEDLLFVGPSSDAVAVESQLRLDATTTASESPRLPHLSLHVGAGSLRHLGRHGGTEVKAWAAQNASPLNCLETSDRLILWVISGIVAPSGLSWGGSVTPVGTTWEREVDCLYQFLSLRPPSDPASSRPLVVLLFCMQQGGLPSDGDVYGRYTEAVMETCALEVHRAMAAAWKRLHADRTHETSSPVASCGVTERVCPWVLGQSPNVVDEDDRFADGRVACFCVGVVDVSDGKPLLPLSHASCDDTDAQSCTLSVSCAVAKTAFERMTQLVQSHVEARLSALVTSPTVRDVTTTTSCPLIPFLSVRWKERSSDCLPLLVITSWKRVVEDLPEHTPPSLYDFIRLLPRAVQKIASSVFFHPLFWNKQSARLKALDILDSVEVAMTSCCDDYVKQHANEADLQMADFQTTGDFITFVRHTVRELVNQTMTEEQRHTQLMVPFPLWMELDLTLNPPWRSLPFPPQCYGHWSSYQVASPCAVDTRKPTQQQRRSLASFGTPPRRRRDPPPSSAVVVVPPLLEEHARVMSSSASAANVRDFATSMSRGDVGGHVFDVMTTTTTNHHHYGVSVGSFFQFGPVSPLARSRCRAAAAAAAVRHHGSASRSSTTSHFLAPQQAEHVTASRVGQPQASRVDRRTSTIPLSLFDHPQGQCYFLPRNVMQRRDFDLLLWGCTGTTGKLAAVLLARRFGLSHPDVRIALGGRSEARLREVAELMLMESIQSSHPEIRAKALELQRACDANPEASLLPLIVLRNYGQDEKETHIMAREMCSRSEVVVALAGPYQLCGQPILQACAEVGTDYVDVSGECDWIKEMYTRFASVAKASRARIIPCCGFMSLLNDVGVSALQRQAAHMGASQPITYVEQYCHVVGSRPSGGTLRTLLLTVQKYPPLDVIFAKAGAVYEMCQVLPTDPTTLQANRDVSILPSYSRLVKAWVYPSLSAPGMTRFIHWTNEVKGYPYGKNFVFRLAEKSPSLLVAVIKTLFTLLVMLLVVVTSHCGTCVKRLLPQAGDGPSLSDLERPRCYVKVTTVGVVKQPTGQAQRVEHLVTFKRGEGYAMTAYGVLEVALTCLKKRKSNKPNDSLFGFSCASHLLGVALEDHLRTAGFDIHVRVTPLNGSTNNLRQYAHLMSALVPAAPETSSSVGSAKTQPNTVELQPHQAEVLSVEFSPSGRTIATASADKTIQLISVYGEHERLLTLKGHKGAVLQVHWSGDGDRMLSASSDHDAAIWDLATGQRVKRLSGHDDIVNTCAVGKTLPNVVVTGSDDGNTMLWDLRVMRAVATFPERYQVLAVALDDTMHRVFSGSLDSKIRVTTSPPATASQPAPPPSPPSLLLTLSGHVNAITGIDLSSTNQLLVSNAMDQTIRLWDVRPFCTRGDDRRCFSAMRGATHNFEQTLHRVRWGPDDLCIGAGSADRCAYVFHVEGVESESQPAKLLYKLPGHAGAVTEVCFHPTERVIATAGTDRKVFIRKLG